MRALNNPCPESPMHWIKQKPRLASVINFGTSHCNTVLTPRNRRTSITGHGRFLLSCSSTRRRLHTRSRMKMMGITNSLLSTARIVLTIDFICHSGTYTQVIINIIDVHKLILLIVSGFYSQAHPKRHICRMHNT